MAIDKNSKAYQNLLNSGYTDEQITQMHNDVAGGQTTQQTVANTTPVNTPTPSPTQATPEVKQETEVKQQETPITTVPEIKQEGALKPLSQDYYNQTGDMAQKQIRDNLNLYRETNPGLFSSYEDFKKNFSYNARNEEQRNTLDAWYGEYEKGMQLSGVPVTDLYTQYKDGQVSTSDLETLKVYNPTKYAELQNQINKGNIITAYDDDKGADQTPRTLQDMAYEMAMQTFNQFMSGDNSSGASNIFREYEDKMNNSEMLGLSDKCTEVQEEMENIQSDLDSIKKQVEKEYEGTGASRSKINAIISDRSYDLQLQLRTLNSEYNKYATQYNNRMNQYQNEFTMQLQEYQLNQQARNQQMQELGFALDLMNFETNDQKAEREWNYWVKQQEYANGNINSEDHDTRYKAALKSVQNLLAQYPGIPTQRSAEQMADDILLAIDNGSNLGAELTKINKFMQEKPEYKYLYNQTYGASQGFGNMVSIGGQDYVEYDGKLYTAEEFNKKYGGLSKANYNVVSEDVLKYYSDGRSGTYGSFIEQSKYDDGRYIGQCGKFVNDYLEYIGAGRMFGNEDITTRKGWVNSDEGKVGTIAVFDYNHLSSDGVNHGHVGIVVSPPDKNGDFWVKDANFDTKNPGTIKTRKVNLKDVSLKGFIDPSRDQNGVKGGATLASVNSNGNSTISSSINVSSLGISQSQLDSLARDYINGEKTYSDIDKTYGNDILNAVGRRALELTEGGYERSTKITDPTKQANMEQKYKSEYDKAVADAQETIDWVNKMDEAYDLVDSDLNAASQALVIAYNKILDSGSVVREGEYARTAEGQSALKQITSKLQKIAKGGAGISKGELQSLVNVAHKFSENAKKTQERAAQTAKVSIDKYGLTPEAVLPLDVVNQLYGTTSNTNESWYDGLNKSSDVFKRTTNIGGHRAPANFYSNK